MRILVVGAGGTGGYFGGRLSQAGIDVSFLVRPARAQQLRRDGLVVRSAAGDIERPVSVLTQDDLAAAAQARPFDLVLLACKAYDLDSAVDALAPAMGDHGTLLPLLNGLRHYPVLHERFGEPRVLPGLCFISVTKQDDGVIVHQGQPASMTFGERDGTASARVAALAEACQRAGIEHNATDDIGQEQWIKLSFLATLAAGTCLMRASIGSIVSAEGGNAFLAALHEECLAIAAAEGFALSERSRGIARDALTRAGSALRASMLHDLLAGGRTEAGPILGDMLARADRGGLATPLLRVAWVHLQCHEAAIAAR